MTYNNIVFINLLLFSQLCFLSHFTQRSTQQLFFISAHRLILSLANRPKTKTPPLKRNIPYIQSIDNTHLASFWRKQSCMAIWCGIQWTSQRSIAPCFAMHSESTMPLCRVVVSLFYGSLIITYKLFVIVCDNKWVINKMTIEWYTLCYYISSIVVFLLCDNTLPSHKTI